MLSTHERSRCRSRRWLVVAACASACVGTPTPEPPDYDRLPTPDGGIIFGGRAEVFIDVVSHPERPTVPVDGGRGSVAPDTELWIVNLDDPDSTPATVRAKPDGSFEAQILAMPNDRVRLISRTAQQHSLPLDAQCVMLGNELGVMRLPPQELDCLTVSPADEITQRVEAGKNTTRRFELVNRCTDVVQIENAHLRFGDQGFSLATPPSSVSVNGRTELVMTFEGHDDATEHADIVLFDVASGTSRGRYALGIWSLSGVGSGND